VYDLAMVVDAGGRILTMNSIDDEGQPIARAKRVGTVGRQIQEYPDELPWFEKASKGVPGVRDWYRSPLAGQI
jgi:hypothetical protein